RTPAELLNIELTRLNDLLNQGAINWDTYSRAVFAAQDSFDAASKAGEESMSEIDQFTTRAAENIQDAIGDGLVNLMEGNFKDIGSSFVGMLNRMVAEAAAAQLARHLFGDLVKGGEGGGSVGGIFKSIAGALFGGGRANGGGVMAGGLYEINENGP